MLNGIRTYCTHRMGLTRTLFAVLSAIAIALSATAQVQETAEQRDARMKWWRDARFGMFIHWGLYAIPAGEWNGSTNHAEWIRTTAQIPLETYDGLLPQFNPVNFDADVWVRAAKAAGMKYIVITSKHHDGFALFDSKHTDFDVMATPFKRDIMRELADACRRHGLRICWYHSIMDWHHPDYLPRREWEKDSRPEGDADFDRFVAYLHNHVTELLTNYGDIGVMWFDGEWESTWSQKYGAALDDLCRKLQPNIIVNNRVDVGRGGMAGMTAEGTFRGDFGTPEQEIPATGIPGIDWESCITMNRHWGYNKADQHWKSSRELIRMLIDIASKGGNFLLNIGPTAEGEFPPESIERLRDIGSWMTVHSESIYETSAGPFSKLEWGRCTMKRMGDRTVLYLHVFDWPVDGRLIVPGIGNDVISARMLGTDRSAVRVRREGSDLHLMIPASAPDANASVIAMEIAGQPIVYDPPTITAAADILVHSISVTIEVASPALTVRYTIDGSEPTKDSPATTGPLTISDSCILKARAFHKGQPVSSVVEQRFTKVNPKPVDHVTPGAVQGVLCAVYPGEWNRLPDFDVLKASRLEFPSAIELPSGRAEEYVARLYSCWMTVPDDDVYEFALSSDDGSRLVIGDRIVIDNDGLHSPIEKRGVIALAAGPHWLMVHHFNKTGGAECTLRMAPAGKPLQAIDPEWLLRSP